MPIYTYSCACGERFEAENKISERHVAKCKCGADALMVFSPGKVQVSIPQRFRDPVRKSDIEADD